MHIVLVHGAGGTSSTWAAVAPILEEGGLAYSVITNPSQSLEGDVAYTRALLDTIEGPILLVGHSYGGAVITNLGTDDRVVGLVYVAAFAPDEGESVNRIVSSYEPAEVSKYMKRGPNGEWSSTHDDAFWAEIGWDVPADLREALEREEGRESADAIFTQPTGSPAWKVRPSWYLVASEDRTLSTGIQRDMAARAGAITSEVRTSHFTPRVAADVVANLIGTAVRALSASRES